MNYPTDRETAVNWRHVRQIWINENDDIGRPPAAVLVFADNDRLVSTYPKLVKAARNKISEWNREPSP